MDNKQRKVNQPKLPFSPKLQVKKPAMLLDSSSSNSVSRGKCSSHYY